MAAVSWLGAASLVIGLGVAPSAQDRRHAAGQSVTPSFDGWFKNADGSFTLVFGYFNRNFEESVDIPVGPNNRLDSGTEDRGQPTHFLPRRQFGAYALRVPADFGAGTLTWTLINRGGTFKVPGYLRPEWEIAPLVETTTDTKPPLVAFDATGKAGEGPAGPVRTASVAVGAPLELVAWVTARPGEHEEVPSGRGVPILWSHYRGPGTATFNPERPKVDGTGKATTTVRFTDPGEHTLRLLAGVADTTGCCWTNGLVHVTVSPRTAGASRQPVNRGVTR